MAKTTDYSSFSEADLKALVVQRESSISLMKKEIENAKRIISSWGEAIKDHTSEVRLIKAELRKREEESFKASVFQEYGFSLGHDKAEKVWSKAYEIGHENGQEEVANYFRDLAELIL